MNPEIMQLQILKVRDAGDLDNEKIILKANETCEISWYILFDNTYDELGNLSNLWRHVFIFPKIQIKAGDFIWLYTKAGKSTSRGNTSNTTTHLLYWGLGETIWNHEKDVAHLIKYVDSQSLEV
jgi:hypothetical protein